MGTFHYIKGRGGKGEVIAIIGFWANNSQALKGPKYYMIPETDSIKKKLVKRYNLSNVVWNTANKIPGSLQFYKELPLTEILHDVKYYRYKKFKTNQ